MREAAAKIEQQAQKLKGKWGSAETARRERRTCRRAIASPSPEPSRAPRIVRATRYAVKPMSVEDAALRLESTSDAFVVFRNAETDAVSILYRRTRRELRIDRAGLTVTAVEVAQERLR